jgi:hypothetical protein
MDMNRLKRLREALMRDAILASDPEAAKDPERIRQMLASIDDANPEFPIRPHATKRPKRPNRAKR